MVLGCVALVVACLALALLSDDGGSLGKSASASIAAVSPGLGDGVRGRVLPEHAATSAGAAFGPVRDVPVPEVRHKSASRQPRQTQVMIEYRSSVACRRYLKAMAVAGTIDARGEVDVYSIDNGARRLGNLDYTAEALAKYAKECGDVTWEQNNRRLFQAALAAALQGDPHAQACFVDGAFFISPLSGSGQVRGEGHDHVSQALVEKYLKYAPRFMREGVDANYRPMVHLAATKLLSNQGKPAWLQQLSQPDPYVVYRALLLLAKRLPADGSVKSMAAELAQMYSIPSGARAEAAGWASRAYQTQYKSQAIPADSRNGGFRGYCL